MKVALVHDWLTGMRGGERVLERVCQMFPDAPIFTLLWNRGTVSSGIESHRIVTSFLQRLPGARTRYREYLPLFPRAAESLDLSGFDAVISTSHCVAKGARVPAGCFHLSYVLTPMRYVWDLEQTYFPPGRYPWPLSAYVRHACARLREWDVATTTRVPALVACSHHVAERIRRHWNRNAVVVHPFIEAQRFTAASGPRDYLLVAGALAPYKRVDLAIEACRRLGVRLVIAGSGPAKGGLERKGSGVEFTGWVSDERMASLYAGARGLLFPGEEDFGLVPLEAMASGCPVVALSRGGAMETVAAGASAEDLAPLGRGEPARVAGGVVFAEQTAESLTRAIERLLRSEWNSAQLRARAASFSPEAFERGLREAFESAFSTWKLTRPATFRLVGVGSET